MLVQKILLIALLALSSVSLAGCIWEGRDHRGGFEHHDDGDRHDHFHDNDHR
jgi:hypothetical protein